MALYHERGEHPDRTTDGTLYGLTNFMALFYLPASAGGANNAAGWFWGKITSGHGRIIYGNTLFPAIPASKFRRPRPRLCLWRTDGSPRGDGNHWAIGITLPGWRCFRAERVAKSPGHGDTWGYIRSKGHYNANRLGGTLWTTNPNSRPDGERCLICKKCRRVKQTESADSPQNSRWAMTPSSVTQYGAFKHGPTAVISR